MQRKRAKGAMNPQIKFKKNLVKIIFLHFLPALFVLQPRLSFATQPQTLQKAQLEISGKKLTVELAQTEVEMSKGLMYRTQMAENEGMLFIYPSEQPLSFWMKNTFIPLSIGFFNKNRELIEVLDMAPVKSEMQLNLPSYRSRLPAKYALEVNQGWFKRNQIKLKSKFKLSSDKE